MGVYKCVRHSKVAHSKYKYVKYYKGYYGEGWAAQIPLFRWGELFDDEKKAAIAVDIKMIEKGKEPVNVLVHKCNNKNLK